MVGFELLRIGILAIILNLENFTGKTRMNNMKIYVSYEVEIYNTTFSLSYIFYFILLNLIFGNILISLYIYIMQEIHNMHSILSTSGRNRL